MKKLIQSGDDEITRGDAVTLSVVAQLDDVPESIDPDAEFETIFMRQDGQRIVIGNDAHTLVEAGGEDIGAFTVDLSETDTAYIQPGRHVQFCTTATVFVDPEPVGGPEIESAKTFWGTVQVKKKPGE